MRPADNEHRHDAGSSRPPRSGRLRGASVAASVVAALLLVAGCDGSAPSPVEGADLPVAPRPECPSWLDDIQPVFAERCGRCHSGDTPAGRFDAMTYLGAVERRGDEPPAAVEGDGKSALLKVLHPEAADVEHAPFNDLYPTLEEWVVQCDVAYFSSEYHPGGILNPRENPQQVVEFHGELIRQLDWDITTCTVCHGSDYRGGRGGSCYACHTEGPGSCDTCHDQPPTSAAHGTHAQATPVHAGLDCRECHRTPETYAAPGHYLLADGQADPPPAEVEFPPDGLAAAPRWGTERQDAPVWDPSTGRCSQVYCHGDVFADEAREGIDAGWQREAPASQRCERCHGLPPANHAPFAMSRCTHCHSRVVDEEGRIIDPEEHINGRIVLGDGSEGCSACHGGPDGPAPAPDLDGESDPARPSVGAHSAHLNPTHGLRGPIACEECHRVPEELTSPGHVDSELPAEVFPGPSEGAHLAWTLGAEPRWDPAGATCSGVYCHGGGVKLAGDRSEGLQRTPVWTRPGTGQVECGACHGVPPVDGVHSARWGLERCVDCHAETVDEEGAILVDVAGTSRHIDGRVDLHHLP